MKLLECTRDELLVPLQAVSGIVERRHTLPILSNVLLERAESGLSLLATDLEMQIATRAGIEGKGQPASVTTSARKLQDILRALPPEAKVVLESSGAKLQLKAGRSRFMLQTLPVEDFPRLGAAAEAGVEVKVAQKHLRELLHLVHYAMAQQDIRYYLNGLLLALEGRELRVVATDGHRLAFAKTDLSEEHARQEVVLPRKAVLELAKLLADDEDEVSLSIAGNQVHFAFSDVVLVTKIVDGKFPDYARVIPVNYQNRIALDRLVLLQALQRVAILSNDKYRGVRWMLTDGSLRISCTNTEQEEAQEELEIGYSGPALDIGFNVNYLLDVLNAVKGEKVECAFGDANSSVLMTEPDIPAFKYVIMPMRI